MECSAACNVITPLLNIDLVNSLCVNRIQFYRNIWVWDSYCLIVIMVMIDEAGLSRPNRPKTQSAVFWDTHCITKNCWLRWLECTKYLDLLPQTPDSPHLALNDYWLFPGLKEMLQEKRFTSNDSCYRRQTLLYHKCIQMLVKCLDCINLEE